MSRRTCELRERFTARLTEDYAASHIEVEEFERAVERMEAAESEAELLAIGRELELEPAGESTTALPRSVSADVVPAQARGRMVFAVMAGVERRGAWEAPPVLRVFAVMGGVVLDFRDVRFPAQGVRLQIVAIMGGVEVIVPEGARVECSGVAIMGGFEHEHEQSPEGAREGPLLSITGFALMGGVEVAARMPGESARQARSRRKSERRRALKRGGA